MAEDLGDKTEAPTARRRQESRDKGQVAKSQDLGAAAMLAVLTTMCLLLAADMLGRLAGLMRIALSNQAPGDPLGLDSIFGLVRLGAAESVWMLAPFLSVAFLAALISQGAQVGPLFTLEPLSPKLNRLSPLQGVKRIFGMRGLIKTIVSVGKILVALLASWIVLGRHAEPLAAVVALPLNAGVAYIARVCLELAVVLTLLLLVLAVIDFLYQRWQHTRDLRMTKQQVKDERKDMDGSPEMRGRRLRMARELAAQRTTAAVPNADVIVTNPTHFSVALKYDESSMGAPRVVAKGADLLALRIRQLAGLSGVPIVERPPLARALYWNVEVGSEVHPEHYEAVADVLAYVYRTEAGAKRRPAAAS